MEIKRETRTRNVCSLQLYLRHGFTVSLPVTAVIAEYALCRTDDRIFSGVRGVLNGELPPDFQVNDIRLSCLTEKYGVDNVGGLCLMNYILNNGNNLDSLKELAERIAAEEEISGCLSLVAAACARDSFDSRLQDALTRYAEGTLAEDFELDGLPLAAALEEFDVKEFIGLSIMNINLDHDHYLDQPLWALDTDRIEIPAPGNLPDGAEHEEGAN